MDNANFNQGTNLPIGLAMGIAMDKNALNNYVKLTEYEKEKLIAKSKGVKTKEEMQQLIRCISEESI